MQIKQWLTFPAAAAALVSALAAAPAAADTFPTKRIQLVIPFAPGDTDSMLRPFAEKMGEFLGQPVVLNYKPGAGGGVGAGFVATSKPDGYTLVGSSPGSIVVVPLANKEVRYTPDSFTPVAALVEGGLMLVVASSSPWHNVKELVEHSKKNPGTITYTSSGAMGITHLLAEIFSKEAGVKWSHIPYQGSAPGDHGLAGRTRQHGFDGNRARAGAHQGRLAAAAGGLRRHPAEGLPRRADPEGAGLQRRQPHPVRHLRAQGNAA